VHLPNNETPFSPVIRGFFCTQSEASFLKRTVPFLNQIFLAKDWACGARTALYAFAKDYRIADLVPHFNFLEP